MARTVSLQHNEPIANINVTPFIDVLLVLLIMIILTVPIATHKVAVDLPRAGGKSLPEEPHKLLIDKAGALQWDGRTVGDAELPALLAGLKARPNATLQLQADAESRYERFDRILAVIKGAGITRLGFVGNEHMAL